MKLETNHSRLLPAFRILAPVVALAALALTARATPYATGLTNNAGVSISFRLNEAADNVTVISGAGFTTTNNLGAMTAGLKTSSLAISGPFKVIVSKSGVNTIGQIGSTISVNSPRGVAVNNNPASRYFGRIYMANSAGGTAAGDGIYLYNSDLSNPFGTSTNLRTAGYGFVASGVSSPMRISVAPNDQLYVSDWSDVTGDLIATDPDVTSYWYVLGKLQTNAATSAIGVTPVGIGADGRTNNHGSVYGAYATGSTNTGDLVVYTMDEDYQQDPTSAIVSQMNSLWRYDIGSGPLPWTNPPNKVLAIPSVQSLSQNGDLAVGPNGFVYLNQRRANAGVLPGGTWSPSLMVVNPSLYIDPTNFAALYDPTNLPGVPNAELGGLYTITSNFVKHSSSGGYVWESQSATRMLGTANGDIFGEVNGIAVSPDGRYIAGITWGAYEFASANQVKIAPLTNGIPDLSRLITFTTGSTVAAGRGVAWDAANNLYILSSGGAYFKVYSLNFTSKAVTGSDGTFSLTLPTNEVWVAATDTLAKEGTPATDTATFTFNRSGDTSLPLTVNYAITGTATNGVDYATIPTSVTFAAGASTTNVVITPIDDTIPEFTETVTLTISGNTNYTALYSKAATIAIADNEKSDLAIVPLFTNMYERVVMDFTRYQLQRRGDTNDAPFVVNLGYGGLVNFTDFYGPTTAYFNPGEVNVNFDLNPYDNSNVTGPRPFTVNVLAATSGEYTVATAPGISGSAPGNVIDDDLPSEAGNVLFSENFETPTGVHNTLPATWKFVFAATNNVNDYDFDFGYDYAMDGFPTAPGATTTLGLKATVNKDVNPFAAAINFYPVGQTFSNSYAFRFNMLLVLNTSSNQTEHALFGIDHSGDRTNWWNSSGTVLNGNNQDGLWFGVNSAGGNANDFALFTRGSAATAPTVLSNRLATTMTQTFKIPPYGVAGCPSILVASNTPTWIDVEVAQTTNMVVLRLNNSVVIQTTNITAYTNGNIMLGYNDAFNSIGGYGGAVIYDNVRVVRIFPPSITTQPSGRVAIVSNSVTFSVVATSTTGVTNYQWMLNGVPIAGANSSTYTISNILAGNFGTYTVVVDDGRYPITSQPAVLSQATLPVIIPSLSGTTLTLKFNTQVGPTYIVEYKQALSDSSWTTLTTIPGIGGSVSPTDSTTSSSLSRFYRVRLQ